MFILKKAKWQFDQLGGGCGEVECSILFRLNPGKRKEKERKEEQKNLTEDDKATSFTQIGAHVSEPEPALPPE